MDARPRPMQPDSRTAIRRFTDKQPSCKSPRRGRRTAPCIDRYACDAASVLGGESASSSVAGPTCESNLVPASRPHGAISTARNAQELPIHYESLRLGTAPVDARLAQNRPNLVGATRTAPWPVPVLKAGVAGWIDSGGGVRMPDRCGPEPALVDSVMTYINL